MRVGCDRQCGGCCCIMRVRDMVLAAREFAFNYVQVMLTVCPYVLAIAEEGAHAHMVGQCVMPLAAAPLPSPPRRFPLRAVGFQPVPTASRWLILVAGASTRHDIWSGLRGLAVALHFAIAVAVEFQCGRCCRARSGNCYTGRWGTCVCPAAFQSNVLVLLSKQLQYMCAGYCVRRLSECTWN